MRRCDHCGHGLEGCHPAARFCSPTCSKRAHRRRRAGLPEHAYPDGAARGRVALGELTAAERQQRLRELAAARPRARPRSSAPKRPSGFASSPTRSKAPASASGASGGSSSARRSSTGSGGSSDAAIVVENGDRWRLVDGAIVRARQLPGAVEAVAYDLDGRELGRESVPLRRPSPHPGTDGAFRG